ncbi:DUF6458 family protein [Planotetraspora kaengkrachanensis]|uniref:DUF6458 domain-containing protein n=1 Tax=Planotetraspora kaengkrachanensis TaxID=575193 RepID=A0A8J3PPZ6_9ACTN|nr:DUF6458 family protein [Planotetraspora kaengkrachanensis]GIG76879.1 hypothetical protein Pka01_00060 [Planotetraspora kaengkrachanensis]
MGFGASLAFLAIGAVLAFAVKWDVPGIDLQMIGWILMAVGAVGALLTGLYTRRPHAEDTVETIEPDVMYTVDPPAQPHVVPEPVRETQVEPTVRPSERHVYVEEQSTTPIKREGV